MKHLLIFLSYCITGTTGISQSYYSKIFKLESSIIGSEFGDFAVEGNNLFVYTGIFCEHPNIYYSCAKLLHLDLDANILKERFLDSLSVSDNFNALSKSKNNFYLSSNPVFVNANTIFLYKLNDDFKNENFLIDSISSKDRFINRGIYYLNDKLFTFEVIYSNLNPKLPTLGLTNRDTSTLQQLWTKNFYLGDYAINAHDLQVTSDNYLSFIMYASASPGIPSFESTIKILKINWEGNVVDSFQCFDDGMHYKSMLSSNSGDYYFATEKHPLKPIYTVGSINKLNKDLEFEWSLTLPNNQLKDGRIYRIARITECTNGDILVTGRVWENSDSKVLGADISSVYNGYLCRIKSSGTLDWIRIFKLPQELLNKEIYGPFRPSILEKAIELSNGDIIAYGEAYYNNHQNSGIDIFKYQINQLWMIKLNSSGCLPDYQCDTIIRLRPIVQPETANFNIGTQWTFETDYYLGGGHSIIEFHRNEIIDTSRTNGMKIFSLGVQDSFYVENDKMYFWDEMLKSYEMHYDFNSTTGYEIKYWDFSRNSIQIATVKVDSVYNTIIGSDTIQTQLLRISNGGSFVDPYIIPVYKNIGASELDIKLYLGFGLFDPNPITTKLRCFKSGNIEYNFQSYSCDSTWFTTYTDNPESKELNIIPNPTTGKIKIHGIDFDIPFSLFNLQGQSIVSGNSNDGEIEVPLPGVFILKMKVNERYYYSKVIRL